MSYSELLLLKCRIECLNVILVIDERIGFTDIRPSFHGAHVCDCLHDIVPPLRRSRSELMNIQQTRLHNVSSSRYYHRNAHIHLCISIPWAIFFNSLYIYDLMKSLKTWWIQSIVGRVYWSVDLRSESKVSTGELLLNFMNFKFSCHTYVANTFSYAIK